MRNDFFKTTTNNHIEFLAEGEAYYKSYLDLIQAARESIHLQTYIFAMDNFGSQVQKSLIQASQRGVKVYLLVDRIGSMNLTDQFANELVEAGVYFCRFNGMQIKWLWQWGRRLHHKVLLVDQMKAIIGGINVISSSFSLKNVVPHLDFAVVLQGNITKGLTIYCQQIFRKAYGKIKFAVSHAEEENFNHPGLKLKISINDWFSRRRQIAKQYEKLIALAKKDILIINPYFFPRRKFMRQLRRAAKRGVRLRLILPKYSDWPSYNLASQYLYAYFLKNGIEIYQWNQSILHGKLACIDRTYSTIGSFNLNYMSYQQNLEMNVDITSQSFTEELSSKIDDWIVTGCKQIDKLDFLNKTTYRERVLRYFLYVIFSLMANFSISLAFRGRLK